MDILIYCAIVIGAYIVIGFIFLIAFVMASWTTFPEEGEILETYFFWPVQLARFLWKKFPQKKLRPQFEPHYRESAKSVQK